VRVLVATDIAARGLDIDRLPHVVNYELPNVPEDYVHRIGRTGRAGEEGVALSLVSSEERQLLADIQRLLKRELPVEIVPGFEPSGKEEPILPTAQRGRRRTGGRDQRPPSRRSSGRHPRSGSGLPQRP